MKDLKAAARDVIAECNEDYVGLLSVIRRVREIGVTGYAQLQATTLTLIKELMKNKIVAGQFENHIFKKWECSVEEATARIERAWNALGREPNIGDIVWFVAPTNVTTSKMTTEQMYGLFGTRDPKDSSS